MADSRISDLPAAEHIEVDDLLVVSQSGAAKKLSGNTLVEDLKQVIHGQGYATFYVDVESGLLHMVTPELYNGPVFRLDNGKLVVTVNG